MVAHSAIPPAGTEPEDTSSGNTVSFLSSYKKGERFSWYGTLTADIADDLLLWAKERRASDVTLMTNSEVWPEMGGMWRRITERPLTDPEVENFVRVAYGADNGPGLVRSGRDIDPAYEVRMPTGLERYRLNVTAGRIPGGVGFQMTFRTLPKSPPRITELPDMEQDIIENLRPEMGLVLVTGPTGSGKSTLLYAGLRSIMEDPAHSEKVLDYSKPIEYTMDGLKFPNSFIWQTEPGKHLINPDDKSESGQWQYAIRNSLRRKPEIILIGESRDRPTFDGCLQSCLTGHLTFTTMHTTGVPETIRRALKFYGSDERRGAAIDMLDALHMVITQRLVRRADGQGMVAVREYLIFDASVNENLVDADPDTWPALIREMMKVPVGERRVKSQSLTESALKLHERGIITKQTLRHIAARQRNEAMVVGASDTEEP